MRLLEVVADHLFVLSDEPFRLLLEPRGDALVQIDAHLLQQPAIGRVPNEDVVEPVDRLVDPVRADRLHELLAPQAFEARLDLVPHGRRGQLAHGSAVELLPDGGGRWNIPTPEVVQIDEAQPRHAVAAVLNQHVVGV